MCWNACVKSALALSLIHILAAKIGIHTDSDFRIRSGILYTMQLAAMDGHT